MTSANDRKQIVRCWICGRRPVPTKDGRIASHLSPGGVKCHAIGQRIHPSQILNVK